MSCLGRFLFAGATVLGLCRGAERDVVRSFSVQPGCSIAIDTYRGNITVTESDAPEVRVAVHLAIGADSDAEAERLLQGFQLQFEAGNNRVSVRARHPAETRARFIWNENRQIEPTFRVTVPRECSVDLKTSTGGIVVGSLTGRQAAHAENGTIFFRHEVGTVDASTVTGDIVVSHCDGSVHAQVLHGTIRVGIVTGQCDLRNSAGDVDVLEARRDLHVYAEVGTASIGLARNFSGKAEIATSAGNIITHIDPAANCDIRASASLLAHIETRLPLQIENGRDGGRRLVGRLNRGGPLVVLHASGGNIKLLPGEMPFERPESGG